MDNFVKPQFFPFLREEAPVQPYHPPNHKIMAHSSMCTPRFDNGFAESTSSSTGNVQDAEVSDSESSVIGSKDEEKSISGLMRIGEGDKVHGIISKKFLSGLGCFGSSTQITAIHKETCCSFTKQAKLQSFIIYSKAVEKKCGGNANVKYAWFGASKDEINNIFSYGFSHPSNNGAYSQAICLSPDDNSLDCVQTAVPDKNGLRHLLLCRVILGKSEVVHPGSGQCHPSSEEFDTGVDSLLSPRKYIVWSTHMNSYVFPEFMVSFRVVTSHVKDSQRNGVSMENPKSPWITFPALISTLSKFLPPQTVKLITKYHNDYKGRKMTRRELIQQVRKLAGDELLTAIIKSCKNKQSRGSTGNSSRTSSINFEQRDGRCCACQKSC